MPAYNTKPAPCPRCAAEAVLDKHGEAWAVICTAVLCRLIGPRRTEQMEAINVWNARRPA
jgi:hypothetical protein